MMAQFAQRWAPLLTGVALFLCSPAYAVDWQIDHSVSTLGFTAEADRPRTDELVTFDAVFDRWEAQVTFDPDRPRSARIQIDIDMSSLSSEDLWGANMARGPDWLGVDTYPQATWQSNGVWPQGDNLYRLRGNLRLRDQVAPVTVEAKILFDGATAQITGSGEIRRSPFGIGAWASPEMVAPTVTVTFDILAHSRP